MQTKFRDGSVMVCGGCSKDAELTYVGEKNSRLCKVGLSIGKRPSESGGTPDTVWCNVSAWHDAAEVLSQARRGQRVLAIGTLKSHEYEGKTYTELEADFVSICAPSSGHRSKSQSAAPPVNQFEDIEVDDGELPF